MKRIKAMHSFASNGYSMFFGKEIEVDDELAEDWKNAGLVEIVGEEFLKGQEDPAPTAEEIERKNLEAMAKQYGFNAEDLFQYNTEYIEDLIHAEITKRKEARNSVNSENPNGTEENQEGNGQEDPAPTDENEEDKTPKKTKK